MGENGDRERVGFRFRIGGDKQALGTGKENFIGVGVGRMQGTGKEKEKGAISTFCFP